MITLLDGAVGTTLWAIAEKNNVEKKPVWTYNIEHPEFVRELHKRYIDAGSKIILANTFGANEPAVKRSSNLDPHEVVFEGVKIAKEAVRGTDVKVCLSMGPLTMLLEPYGDLTEEECFRIYKDMVTAGVEAGCDMILCQTFIDLNMMKVAVKAAKTFGLPVFACMSFEKVGKTMFGNSVKSVCEELEDIGVDAIGLNCSLGPDLALPIIKRFFEATKLPIIYKPNAGLPITGSDGKTQIAYTAEQFAKEVEPSLQYVSYVGGCCGTDDEYIRSLKEMI